MTRIKLLNDTILDCVSVDIVNGNLEIVTEEKSCEELQEIFLDKTSLTEIELYTESLELSGKVQGYILLAKIEFFNTKKKVVLVKTQDDIEKELVESRAELKKMRGIVEESKRTIEDLSRQLLDTQIAITEIYESRGGN